MPVIVTSAGSSRWHAVWAAVFAAIAVWLSTGAIAFRNPSGARVGVLPISMLPLAVAALAAGIVFAIGVRNRRGAAVAVSPLVLVVIPWLPVTLPPAFLIWTGAFTIPIWIGVGLALSSAAIGDRTIHRRWLASPRAQMRLAFVAACAVFGLAAWSASASIPGGDEPHYLVITQSLLHDRDLNVENNYAQGDYREYYGGPLSPDFRVRGRHGELYSIHAPGIPALVLPAYAIGGYHAVVAFLILISAGGCALAWWLAWRATNSRSAAWFGWAVVAFAAPFLLESFTVYPDGPGAAIVLTAFWALRRIDAGEMLNARALALHGAALAALPWMHTRFALLAILLGLLIVLRLLTTGRPSRIPAFLAVPILSAVGWVAAAYAMYGTLNPAAAYGGQSDTALAFLPNGIGGLLFDQGFGLIATAPALAIALAALPRTRRFMFEWGLVAVVYATAVGSYAMWWAGTSGPARFLVPLILPLALPAAVAWQRVTSRGARVAMTMALAVTVWISTTLVSAGGGLLAYHSRNVYGPTPAPWIEWANKLVPLSQAMPAFVPLPRGTPLGARMAAARDGFASMVPWIGCFAMAAYLTVWLGRKRGARLSDVVAAAVAGSGAATMIAASIGWWMHGGPRIQALEAQLDLVRRLSDQRGLALDLEKRRLSGIDALKLRLDVPIGGDEGGQVAAVSIPLLPAGTYRISPRGSLTTHVAIFAGADEEPFPIAISSAADFARGVTVDLPVTVRALTLRATSFAGAGAIEVRPTDVRRVFSGAVAHHAAAYGSTRVFFLDDRTAPEEDGFWIWGAREGELVFQSGASDFAAVVRNGAVHNDVRLRSGAGEEQFTLQPEEQRPIRLSASSNGTPLMVRIGTSAGFRPADVDPRSRDRRFLGVYVVMPEHAVR
jgi:hypothetical protein